MTSRQFTEVEFSETGSKTREAGRQWCGAETTIKPAPPWTPLQRMKGHDVNDFANVPPAEECMYCKVLMTPGSIPVSSSICPPCLAEIGWRMVPILLLIPWVMIALEIAPKGVV